MQKQTVKLDIREITKTTATSSSEGLASWAMAVIDSKFFTTLPSCFEEVVIPKDTRPSTLNLMTCYKNVIAHFKTTGLNLHPSKTLENILFEQSVSYSPKVVVTSEKVTYEVKKGFLVNEKESNEVAVIASGFVSTNLAYHAKVDNTGRIADLPKSKDLVSLNWKYPDLGSLRVAIKNTTKSPNIAQAEMYNSLRNAPLLAVHFMSGILNRVPEFSVVDDRLSKAMTAFYDKNKIPTPERFVPRVPVAIKLKTVVTEKGAVENFWLFVDRSRQIRGEDAAGIGTLSIGYYFGDHPRTLIKHISFLYDLRALLKFYKVDHLIISRNIPDFVKRSLVLNGYWVITGGDISLPRYNSDVPGIYTSIGKGKDALEVRDFMCERPKIMKNVVMWPEVDIGILECSMVSSSQDQATRYVVAKLPMLPILEKSKFALFPSSQPHNGYVWVGGSEVGGSFRLPQLALRSLTSNIYRNHYPLNRVPFWTFDSMNAHFSFGESIVLARMSTAKIVKEELAFPFDDGVDKDKPVIFDASELKVDVSEWEKVVTEEVYTLGDIKLLSESIRKAYGENDKALKDFLFFQYSKIKKGKNPNFYLARLLKMYAMREIYEVLYKLGNFDDDFKEYNGEQTSSLELPINDVIDVPESVIPETDKADDLSGFGFDFV
jgi:hypothetical protein